MGIVITNWETVWDRVAEQIAGQVEAGRLHLLTEDTIRFATIMALGEAGVEPRRLTNEYPAPAISGSIDLVVDDPPTVAIEFKYPRGARVLNTPYTMVLGSLIADFYRLARLEFPESWVVQVAGSDILAYLKRKAGSSWSWTSGGRFTIDEATRAALPETARRKIPDWAIGMTVAADCVRASVLGDLTLAAYRIEAPTLAR